MTSETDNKVEAAVERRLPDDAPGHWDTQDGRDRLAAEVAKYRSYPSAAPMWDILNAHKAAKEAAEAKLSALVEALGELVRYAATAMQQQAVNVAPYQAAILRARQALASLDRTAPDSAEPAQEVAGLVEGHQTYAHAANEWADAFYSAVQWVRNIRDGINLPGDALANMEECEKHCQEEWALARKAAALASSPSQGGETADLDLMVSRFLSWPLPKTFSPDCGIKFTALPHPHSWPIGTNLLSADQAREMLQYVVGAFPREVAEADVHEIIERGKAGMALSLSEQASWNGYELGWRDGHNDRANPLPDVSGLVDRSGVAAADNNHAQAEVSWRRFLASDKDWLADHGRKMGSGVGQQAIERLLIALDHVAADDNHKALVEALGKRAYVTSENHLSGARVTIGFESLTDAQDTHDAIAGLGR